MMFKKWHTTGRNKIKNVIAGLLVLVTLAGIPSFAASPKDFKDLDKKAWYYEEVCGAINAGLFQGESEKYFNVNGNITRAAFVTALSRLCNADTSGYTVKGLKDVKSKHWFYKPVAWAYKEGICQGVSENEFDPNSNITREAMCKMLANAIEKVMGVPMEKASLKGFKDRKKISEWAIEWVQKCVNYGIFKGDEKGKFNPQQNATRAQAACVFYRSATNEVLVPRQLKVSGFTLDMVSGVTTYVVKPKKFEKCKILSYTGFKSIKVKVVHANGDIPYEKTPYQLGDALNLGYGDATVTVTAYTFAGEKITYKITFVDPRTALPMDISVSGFDMDFDPYVTSYTAQPADFEKCKILGFGGFQSIKIKVVHQSGYVPYKSTAYKLGDALNLGYGNATATITATLPDGTKKKYTITFVDPRPEDTWPKITVSGFDLNFKLYNDYYLAQPKNFKKCKILGYEGFQSIAVSVEHYGSHYPYKEKAYEIGKTLNLGNGRAKITITATLPSGEVREYLIALTDPNAAEFAYARARVTGTVNMRAEPNEKAQVLTTFVNNARVYYLKTEGDWCMVEQLYTGVVGYIHKDYLRWEWLETSRPKKYKKAIEALQTAHPNWTFTFVDVEKDYNTYVEEIATSRAETRAGAEGYSKAKDEKAYKAKVAEYYALYLPQAQTLVDPTYYLNEDKIFAFLDIDSYNNFWNNEGIGAIWVNEKAILKADAVNYFNAASKSLMMNPYYIACRAALESGYGTSKYASGTMSGYVGYYNFYGIQCYDSNPDQGMTYAKTRNWNSLFRSIVEGANWIKDQYLDQGATTPYFFRYAGFQNKAYMSDLEAPKKEADILKRAYTDPNAPAHFIIPVYANMP